MSVGGGGCEPCAPAAGVMVLFPRGGGLSWRGAPAESQPFPSSSPPPRPPPRRFQGRQENETITPAACGRRRRACSCSLPRASGACRGAGDSSHPSRRSGSTGGGARSYSNHASKRNAARPRGMPRVLGLLCQNATFCSGFIRFPSVCVGATGHKWPTRGYFLPCR